jgi:hypothetical protein
VKRSPRLFKCPLCEASLSNEKFLEITKKRDIQKILLKMARNLDDFIFALNCDRHREPPKITHAIINPKWQSNLQKRRGAPDRGKTKKITCIITGFTRVASSQLLAKKPPEFAYQYICRKALRLLRQGMSVEQTREKLGCDDIRNYIPEPLLLNAIKINGKH